MTSPPDPAEPMIHVARGAVADFIANNPDYLRLRDDLIGEAQLTLVEVVRRRPHASEGYIFVACKHALVEYARQLSTFSVPKSTVADCRRDGRAVPELPRDASRDELQNLESDDEVAIEFNDELEECCEDELDSRIVELRSEGYTCEEIGEELRKSKGCVSKRLKKIAKRYRMRETN